MLWSTAISFVNHSNIRYLNDSEKKVHFGIDNTWGGIRLYVSTDSAPNPGATESVFDSLPNPRDNESVF
jgi:hypothetical protein